jgi:hypothetical protein
MVAFGLYALIRVLQNLVALAPPASEIIAWFLTQLKSTNILVICRDQHFFSGPGTISLTETNRDSLYTSPLSTIVMPNKLL